MKRIKRMPADEARIARREVINKHLWTVKVEHGWDFQLHNIRLIVRLYERQYYGKELDVYRYFTAKKR